MRRPRMNIWKWCGILCVWVCGGAFIYLIRTDDIKTAMCVIVGAFVACITFALIDMAT